VILPGAGLSAWPLRLLLRPLLGAFRLSFALVATSPRSCSFLFQKFGVQFCPKLEKIPPRFFKLGKARKKKGPT